MPQNHQNTKTHPDNIGKPLPKELEIIGKKIVDVRRRRIHKTLGPGLLEKVYDGIIFQEGLRLDVLSHLKLTNKRLGYLINFSAQGGSAPGGNVVNIGQGIKRFVL